MVICIFCHLNAVRQCRWEWPLFVVVASVLEGRTYNIMQHPEADYCLVFLLSLMVERDTFVFTIWFALGLRTPLDNLMYDWTGIRLDQSKQLFLTWVCKSESFDCSGEDTERPVMTSKQVGKLRKVSTKTTKQHVCCCHAMDHNYPKKECCPKQDHNGIRCSS